jgi:hypothetical protein
LCGHAHVLLLLQQVRLDKWLRLSLLRPGALLLLLLNER